MSEDLEHMAAALSAAPGVDEFTAVGHTCERAELQAGADVLRRTVRGSWIDVTVHRDMRRGRGSTRFCVPGTSAVRDHDRSALLAAAVERAALSLGPAWSLPPSAAPARVEVADAALGHNLERAATELLGMARQQASRSLAGEGRVGHWHIALERCRTEARSSRGFAHAYDSTLCVVDAVLTAHGQAVRVRVQARQRRDLDLGGELGRTLRRMRNRARAAQLEPGSYDLVITGRALLPEAAGTLEAPGPTDHVGPSQAGPAASFASFASFASWGLDQLGPAQLGWFGPMAAQADGRMARLGLTRYRPGQSIYGNRPATGDPLTVASDGTVPHGLLSRPFGSAGEPVRAFFLIRDGVAMDLALDPAEAALRGVTANGGIRNLVIAPGRTAPGTLRARAERPVLEVVDLAWLEIDPRTGELAAEIALAYAESGTPVTGGAFRGNLFDFLADARLSSQLVHTGWYHGPEAIRLVDVTVT